MNSEPAAASARKRSMALAEQPMAALALFFGVGLWLGLRLDAPVFCLLGALALLWAGMALGYVRGRSIALPLCLFAFLTGMTAMSAAVPEWYRRPEGAGKYENVRGTVTDTPVTGERSVRVTLGGVEAYDGEWRKLDGLVALTIYGTEDPDKTAELFAMGSVVEGALTLTLPPAAQYAGGYDERLRAMTEGVRFEALSSLARLTVTPGCVPWWRTAVNWAGRRVRQAAGEWIGGEEAAAVCALLTGDKTGLSDETREGFGVLGIAHLLAVSGLHVGIVLLAAGALGRRFRWGSMTVTAISAGVLAFYFLLTGPRPSMMRALALWVLLTAGRMAGRRYSPVSGLAAAFVFLLLLRPLDLLDTGFQLSFLSAAGIILLYPPLEARLARPLRQSKRLPLPLRKAAAYLVGLLLVTGCVYAATWPWMARYFGIVAPGAFAANLLFVPCATLLLMASLVFAALAVASPVIALPVAAVLRPFVRWWLWLVRWAAQRAPVIALPDPPAAALVLSGTLVLALSPAVWRVRARWRAVTAAVLAAAVVAACVPWTSLSGKTATVRTLGDGNAVLVAVETNASVPLLILDRRVYYVENYWKSRGLEGPERLVFTGIDAQDLREVLDDAGLIETVRRIAVPESLAGDMAALTEELGLHLEWEAMEEGWTTTAAGVTCRIACFRAKSAGSKVRYAALISNGGEEALYIDPRYLPGGVDWAAGLETVVVSRMTASRLKALRFIGAEAVVFTDGGGLSFGELTVLDGSRPVLYNMNDVGSVVLMTKDAR